MNIQANLTPNGRKALKSLQDALGEIPVDLIDVINDAGAQIFSVSQRYVPVDTGNLKGSGRLELADVRAPAARITYGAEYALVVHETHRTQSQYLNRAVDPVLANLPRDVADRIEVRLDD